MNKFKWIAVGMILLLALLHYTGVLVIPLPVLITLSGISLVIRTVYDLYKAKKEERKTDE